MTRHDVLRVAAEAGVDPRTVSGVVNGEGRPRSHATRHAILTALEACGFIEDAERLGKDWSG